MCQTIKKNEKTATCDECGNDYPARFVDAEYGLCCHCFEEMYGVCEDCGEATEKGDLLDDVCFGCRESLETETQELTEALNDAKEAAAVAAAMAFLKAKGYEVK
jgi:acetyl-CoA carboxylase beta subunit